MVGTPGNKAAKKARQGSVALAPFGSCVLLASDARGVLERETAPGSMWLCPWYHDPASPDAPDKRARALEAIKAGKKTYLSRYYWEDWADKRPPICVICPDGSHWVVDARSSNGEGWKVTGSAPLITCDPSILVPNYHGYLRDGKFTEDLDAKKRAKT